MPIVASFPSSDTTVSFIFPYLYVKNSVGGGALSKDRLLFGKGYDLSPAVDGRKEFLGIEFAEFLGCYHGCHDGPLLKGWECAKGNFL